MTWFPQLPDVPESDRAIAEVPVRYEDIAQDGRAKLEALPHALGAACWRAILSHHPLTAIARDGIVPILSRLVIEAGGGPISVRHPLEAHGRVKLGHTRGPDSEVERLRLDMFAEVFGRKGRTHGPPPPEAGSRIAVGRVFAEHVFTRPFAPKGARKVLALHGPGLPAVPPDRVEHRSLDACLGPPAGGAFVEDALRPDPVPLVLGLLHTDANQHVNSLVYPRLLEEAALRRLGELGRDPIALARYVELAYRKPFFAGDRVRILLRAFEEQGRIGMAATFVPDGAPDARPHCTGRILF